MGISRQYVPSAAVSAALHHAAGVFDVVGADSVYETVATAIEAISRRDPRFVPIG